MNMANQIHKSFELNMDKVWLQYPKTGVIVSIGKKRTHVKPYPKANYGWYLSTPDLLDMIKSGTAEAYYSDLWYSGGQDVSKWLAIKILGVLYADAEWLPPYYMNLLNPQIPIGEHQIPDTPEPSNFHIKQEIMSFLWGDEPEPEEGEVFEEL